MAGLTKEQKAERALQAKVLELSGLRAEEFELLSDDEKAAHVAKAKEALAQAGTTKPDDEESDVDDSHLIEVAKDGETLKVHPTCLAAHRLLGWKEV